MIQFLKKPLGLTCIYIFISFLPILITVVLRLHLDITNSYFLSPLVLLLISALYPILLKVSLSRSFRFTASVYIAIAYLIVYLLALAINFYYEKLHLFADIGNLIQEIKSTSVIALVPPLIIYLLLILFGIAYFSFSSIFTYVLLSIGNRIGLFFTKHKNIQEL